MYNKIVDKLQEKIDNGEITLERGEELNDLAYEKYCGEEESILESYFESVSERCETGLISFEEAKILLENSEKIKVSNVSVFKKKQKPSAISLVREKEDDKIRAFENYFNFVKRNKDIANANKELFAKIEGDLNYSKRNHEYHRLEKYKPVLSKLISDNYAKRNSTRTTSKKKLYDKDQDEISRLIDRDGMIGGKSL